MCIQIFFILFVFSLTFFLSFFSGSVTHLALTLSLFLSGSFHTKLFWETQISRTFYLYVQVQVLLRQPTRALIGLQAELSDIQHNDWLPSNPLPIVLILELISWLQVKAANNR